MTSSSILSNKLYVAASSASSCEYHRIVLPYTNLPKMDLKVPIVWFNRLFKGSVEKIVSAKKRGAKVVMDLDDAFELGSDHYLYDAWHENGVTDQILEQMALSDVVTVTNQVLADLVKTVHKNIVIVPNALPFDQDQFTRSTRNDESRLIYVGGPSHAADAALMDFDSGLCVAGTVIKGASHKEVVATVRYMDLYDGHRAAVAPLLDTRFNRCKSNLKLLEAGAKGLPLFASDVHPYKNKVDKITQLIKIGDSWKKRLSQYSDSDLKDLGEATAMHVRKHYQLSKSNKIRKQIFESFS